MVEPKIDSHGQERFLKFCWSICNNKLFGHPKSLLKNLAIQYLFFAQTLMAKMIMSKI